MTIQDKYQEPVDGRADPAAAAAAAAEQPAAPTQEAPQPKQEVPVPEAPQPKVEVEAKVEPEPQKEVSQPVEPAKEAVPTSSGSAVSSDDDQQPAQVDGEEVKKLSQIAFDKGLTVAIEEAKKLNNPYLLDEFHDALTDQLYKELVQKGKLEQR